MEQLEEMAKQQEEGGQGGKFSLQGESFHTCSSASPYRHFPRHTTSSTWLASFWALRIHMVRLPGKVLLGKLNQHRWAPTGHFRRTL